MPNLGPGFYKKLLEVSSAVQMKPEDILNVMASESGLNPGIANLGGADAGGLLQFESDTLHGLGFKGNAKHDFVALSGEQQLDYVQKLISNRMKVNGGPFASAAQYHVANWLPVALRLPGVKNEDPNTIIVAKNPDRPHLPGISIEKEKSFYNANPSLDFNHDGVITYGDIQKNLQRVAGGKAYQTALADLRNSTGYSPTDNKQPLLDNKKPSSMVADNRSLYDKFMDWFKNNEQDVYQRLNGGKNHSTSPSAVSSITPPPSSNQSNTSAIDKLIDNYLSMEVAASDYKSRKLYKKYLPNNHLTILVSASSFTDAVEFSRILCSVLDIELAATAFTHTNGRMVEVECSIPGPAKECFEMAQQLTESTAKAFETATRKIGGVIVTTKFLMNKKSSYQQLPLSTAEIQYRKFLLKFV